MEADSSQQGIVSGSYFPMGLTTCFQNIDEASWMPTNCATRIFSFLTRDEADAARLVCRTWNSIIDGVGRNQMAKRQIETLEISSNYEYTIKAFVDKKVKVLSFKKFFGRR
jgi:hypothetical protein